MTMIHVGFDFNNKSEYCQITIQFSSYFKKLQRQRQSTGANKGHAINKGCGRVEVNYCSLASLRVIDCLHLCFYGFWALFCQLASYVPRTIVVSFGTMDSTIISSNYIGPENYATTECNGTQQHIDTFINHQIQSFELGSPNNYYKQEKVTRLCIHLNQE